MRYRNNVFNHVCHICGLEVRPEYTGMLKSSIDHIVPVCKGGSDDEDNLHWSHFVCNDLKNHYNLTEEIKQEARRRVTEFLKSKWYREPRPRKDRGSLFGN